MCMKISENQIQEHSVKFKNIQGYLNEKIKFKNIRDFRRPVLNNSYHCLY